MTQSELQAGIQEFWRTKMTIKQCRRYVGHIKKVVRYFGHEIKPLL